MWINKDYFWQINWNAKGLDIPWRAHPTKKLLYGDLPVSTIIRERRLSFVGHCWQAKQELSTDMGSKTWLYWNRLSKHNVCRSAHQRLWMPPQTSPSTCTGWKYWLKMSKCTHQMLMRRGLYVKFVTIVLCLWHANIVFLLCIFHWFYSLESGHTGALSWRVF